MLKSLNRLSDHPPQPLQDSQTDRDLEIKGWVHDLLIFSYGVLSSNFNNRCFNDRYLFSGFSTLLETVFSVLDHRWTQASPIRPQTLEHKMGPCIDQEG